MNTRKTRAKRMKLSGDYVVNDCSTSSSIDPDEQDEVRKSRIRDSNKEFAKRMTLLQTWSNYWSDYSTREGEAYPQHEARAIIKRTKKISCPIATCDKVFTSIGGLKYHYARCNIQRTYKCKVCAPPMPLATRGDLLRHLVISHYTQLPPLNVEQKKIANTYLACESRQERSKKDSFGKRTTGDSEPGRTGHVIVRAFREMIEEVYNSQKFAERPYRDWVSYTRDWDPITLEIDRRRYHPPEIESVHFRLASLDESIVIRTGESIILKKDKPGMPSGAIFYTGGQNTAVAWLPRSFLNQEQFMSTDLIAVAVNCCSMDTSHNYKESQSSENCIQFWTLAEQLNQNGEVESKAALSYIIGHSYGTIFDMKWCPLGASWQPNQADSGKLLPRLGLLALACGDGQIRIISIPHTESVLSMAVTKISNNLLSSTPVFRVKPLTCLMAPGVGPSTDYQKASCKCLHWNIEDNQRLIAAGWANGNVALYDLGTKNPMIYSNNHGRHIYQPLKCWVAHGAPVTGIAISSRSVKNTFIATGSLDRTIRLWNPMNLKACISTDRPPVTKITWDFRYRGVVNATDSAFTSFNNKVTYKYPAADCHHNITISTHRSSVWGLANSIVTSAVATSDAAGEVFVMPKLTNRNKRGADKNYLGTNSIFSMIPYALRERERGKDLENIPAALQNLSNINNRAVGITIIGGQDKKAEDEADDEEEDDEVEREYIAERTLAYQPDKFLLPEGSRAIETYPDFKANFGLNFVHYESHSIDSRMDQRIPESCSRAADPKNIYCDRPCDYPFSSISCVEWSPNVNNFSYLLSASQIGLCRIDKIQIVEQIYRGYVETLFPPPTTCSVDTSATINNIATATNSS